MATTHRPLLKGFMMGKPKKPRKISYHLIPEDENPEMYALLQRLVTEDHDHLIDAVIKLAWCTSWKPDANGILTLGKCKLASDLVLGLFQYVP
jgi:hypothetical protein